jgi:hypothetical protein
MKSTAFLLALLFTISSYCQVILFDDANFSGQSKILSPGSYRLFDYNDIASSVRVPAGMGAVIFEHADDGGGYGVSLELLEDIPDLSQYNFNNKLSYITVYSINTPGFVWARSKYVNGEYVPGHWERQRANGTLPPNYGPVLSPFYPAHGPGMNDCNPNHCLDLLDRFEALNAGAMSNYFPTADELKPVMDSIIVAFEKSPEGQQLMEQYNEASKEYKNKYAWWLRLPSYKRDQIEEPVAPENPLANKMGQFGFAASNILKAKNHIREIETTRQSMRNCQCDMIGYGNPTPVFTNSATVANDIRTTLPIFTDNILYDKAVNDQLGIIGSDYRPRQNIGSACFEREFTGGGWGELFNFLGASNINFWFPQKRKNETGHYKQTLSGRLASIHQAEIDDILPDHDVNIDIAPSANYNYLLSEAHVPEITTITSISFRKENKTPHCPERFFTLEAEIDTRLSAKNKLEAMNAPRIGQNICVYGPWIFDAGHCDQPEIHPAEQVWWSSTDLGNNRSYYCNVFCDASKRFWWRNQMDDGTKIKPWGAPPIEGTFAIAFETTLDRPAKIYEVSDVDAFNVASIPNSNRSYNLVYQNQTIISFIPHNDAFKVSYERVGLSGNKVRGFLVITTTVGSVKQIATTVTVQSGRATRKVVVPMGTDVNKVDQRYEPLAFEKVEGNYMFIVTRSNFKN